MLRLVTAAVLVVVLGACGDDADEPVAAGDVEAAAERLDAIRVAVLEWSSAESIEDARRAAEEARNLITGPTTFDAGDLDGDGEIAGAAEIGLLPADDGTPGLASALAACASVERDVLGGDWDDAAGRWAVLRRTIDEWSPRDNTYPTLPSHPQRVIGWADNTLALAAEPQDLEEAIEFSGHALLHVDVSRSALDDCTVAD